METVAKADIFFVITSVAVVAVSLLGAVALVYGIKILRDVKDISTRAREEARLISDDIRELRVKVKEEGAGWYRAYSHFAHFFRKAKGRTKSK